MRDVFALVAEESPISGDVQTGDEIVVSAERYDRLEAFGWVHDGDPENDHYRCTVTQRGADIMNYVAHSITESTIGTEIEEGVSTFIQHAIRYSRTQIPIDSWSIIDMSNGDLVIEANGLRREYRLAQEIVEAS